MSKTILAKVKGFTPVIDSISRNTSVTTALVFGGIWRYCQMKDGVCKASIEKVAETIQLDRATIFRHIPILIEQKYLEDLTPNVRNKPHIYRDTGKATLYMGVSAEQDGVAESDTSDVKVSQDAIPGVAESNPQGVAGCDLKIVSFKKEKKKETESEFLEKCNKQVDAILNNELQAQNKKTWRLRELCQDDAIRDLIDVLYQEKRLEPIKSQLMFWIEVVGEWVDNGFQQDDVRAAIRLADEKGYSYNQPSGLTNTIVRVAGARRLMQEKRDTSPREEGVVALVIDPDTGRIVSTVPSTVEA